MMMPGRMFFFQSINIIAVLLLPSFSKAANLMCGMDALLDSDHQVCLCDKETVCSVQDYPTKIFLACIIDTSNFDEDQDIFDFTVKLLKDHADGFHLL
jgi:hypothetical protein